MSKIKIYELAKELDKPSKELVEFLNKKNVEMPKKQKRKNLTHQRRKKSSRYSARRTPRVVEDRVESVRVRDVMTDAITVLRLDVMIREITV